MGTVISEARMEEALRPHGTLVSTADEIFEQYSPYPGNGLRNHCLRLYAFATLLLREQGSKLPADLAYTVAMVHDLGLVVDRGLGANYMLRSHRLLREEAESRALDLGDAPRLLYECLVYNHRVRPLRQTSAEAEAFRRAVWVEHSRGIRTHGLDTEAVRAVFQKWPRANLDRVLADFFARTIRYEPRTIVDGIFF
jgi:hypothetical protein